MPRNGSGVYTLPAGNPVVPGTTIETTWANSTMEDLGNELTNSLSRTGAGGMLGPLRNADGSVTAPSISFTSETNSGLYRSGAASIWMSIVGSNVVQFSSTGLVIASGKALTAQGNATIGGTFGVTGATTLSSTLAVTGAITATGGVLGNITAASGTSTFNNVTINGDLDMDAGSSGTITNLPNPTNSGDAANKAYVDAQDALRLALTGGTMTGAIAMSNNKVTGLATPTADGDAATKAYVDSVAQGIDAKASCLVATTANISLSGTQTIDGVSVSAGQRVLVKDQSTASQNGIYVSAAGSWSRSSDADTWDELIAAYTFIEQGTVNANSGFICTISAGGTLGSTAVTWAQFSGAGQITAGTGMSKTGNTLNVNTASSSRIVVGSDDIDLATTGVTASTYKSVTVDAYGRVTAGTNPTTLSGYGITDAYTQTQVDTALAAKLSLSGGTMTGAIAMGTYKITGLGDPTLAQDAATKNYIDTIFGSTTSAAASAAAAASSASAASTSASNASTSASNASTSATNAASSATSALSYLDTFRGQYIGAASSDPTVDGNGNALTAGDLYFNTSVSEMRVYNGSAWVAAYLPGAGGSTTQVQYNNAGAFAGSANFVWDNSNVRLGIGTSSPSTTLHVVGSSSAITATVSSTSTTINGAPSLKVINAGSATTNQLAEIQFRYEDGTYNANGAIAALRESGTARGQSFIFAPSNSLGDSTERMRISSGGQLIVGNTATGTGADSARIYAYANNSVHNGAAIYGYNASVAYPGVGTTRYGVRGETYGYASGGAIYGVYGYASDTAVYNTVQYGVYGESGPATYSPGYGVYAKATHNPAAAQSGYALFANMNTTGAGSTATTYGARIENNSTAGATNFGLYVYSATGATTVAPLVVAAGGSELMRVNSAGRVGIGTSSPATTLDVTGTIRATSYATFQSGIYNDSFQVYDQYQPTAFYRAYNNVNTIWEIWGGTGAKFWYNTGSVALYPSVDGGIPLGTSSNRWGQIYSTNGSINTSDIREKEQIFDLDDAETRVAVRIKSLFKKFKFKSAVREKGEAARIHFGVMAQEVLAAFEAEGLDAHRYGLFCFDEKWVTYKEVEDKKTGEMLIETNFAKEGDEGAVLQDRYGIRYDELFAFVIAAL